MITTWTNPDGGHGPQKAKFTVEGIQCEATYARQGGVVALCSYESYVTAPDGWHEAARGAITFMIQHSVSSVQYWGVQIRRLP